MQYLIAYLFFKLSFKGFYSLEGTLKATQSKSIVLQNIK